MPDVYTINCCECGHPLAYSHEPLPATPNAKCYLCMHSFCDMANVFHVPHLPNNVDLYAVDRPQTNCQLQRSKVISAVHDLWHLETKRYMQDRESEDIANGKLVLDIDDLL